MAKIKSFNVEYGRTVSIGKFENIKLLLNIEVELEGEDNFEEEYIKAFKMVTDEVNGKAKAIETKFKKRRDAENIV